MYPNLQPNFGSMPEHLPNTLDTQAQAANTPHKKVSTPNTNAAKCKRNKQQQAASSSKQQAAASSKQQAAVAVAAAASAVPPHSDCCAAALCRHDNDAISHL